MVRVYGPGELVYYLDAQEHGIVADTEFPLWPLFFLLLVGE